MTVSRDAARYTPNLRATQVELYDGLSRREPESLAEPQVRRRPGERSAVGVFSRRLLLQDLHVAAQRLEGLVRAPHSPRRRARAGADAARSGSLRSALCALRRAGGRRGPAGIAAALAAAEIGSARHPVRRDKPSSAAACSATPPRASTARPRSTGCSGRSHALGENARVTLLARTTAFGYFPHNFIGLNERLTDHLAMPPGASTARAALAGARAQRGARDRRDRAAAGVSGQRPARNHARRRRADLSEPLRRARRQSRRRS